MTQEYSPLRSPRSRSVVAMVERARQGKHRGGQRKVQRIVEENNRLIRTILGLPRAWEEQTVVAESRPPPRPTLAPSHARRGGSYARGRAQQGGRGEPRSRAQVEMKTSDARHYERLSDKLLSIGPRTSTGPSGSTPSQWRSRGWATRSPPSRRRTRVPCRELDGFERDLEHELEPGGEDKPREVGSEDREGRGDRLR